MAEGLGRECGEALGEGRKQQLLVHQPESKALRLHNTAVQTLQRERNHFFMLGETPALLICGKNSEA